MLCPRRAFAVAITAVAVVQFLLPPTALAQDAPAAAPQATKDDAVERELREEVRRLSERLDKAERRIEELEGAERSDVPAEVAEAFADEFKEVRADRKALARIKLPDDPTREHAAEYIDEIFKASRGQNIFSDSDPQVRLLAAVGPKHADLLIERVGSFSHWTIPALRRVVTDEHRDLVIGSLADQPELVAVVQDKGWEAEAKEVLVGLLKRRTPFLAQGVVEMVAGYEDPTTYPLLLDWLARGSTPATTYQAIAELPGIELDEAVGKAWKRLQRGEGGVIAAAMREFELPSFAPIAAAHGHRDALDELANLVRNDDGGPMHHFARAPARQGFRAVLDFKGSDQALLRWFDEHKAALQWDKARRKFSVPADEAKDEQVEK